MFSIQQLFGKGDKFFDLLEASAQEAHHSVESLVQTLKTSGKVNMDDFVLSRRKDKKITEEIGEQLAKTFVTVLEREDIEALSNALYKIPKTVEKFAERYSLLGEHLKEANFGGQAEIMAKATDTIVAMVKHLRKMPPIGTIKELNDKLQYLEGEADKLMLVLLSDLYRGQHSATAIVAIKDLYELLEKVIDRCRDAGNVVSHIVIKNS